MSLFLDNLEAEIYRTAKYGGVITVRTQDKKVDIMSTCLIDEMNLIMLGGGISALLDQMMESGGRYAEKRENALQVWELVKSSIEGIFLEKYPKKE